VESEEQTFMLSCSVMLELNKWRIGHILLFIPELQVRHIACWNTCQHWHKKLLALCMWWTQNKLLYHKRHNIYHINWWP
jgi:hypothetical protein